MDNPATGANLRMAGLAFLNDKESLAVAIECFRQLEIGDAHAAEVNVETAIAAMAARRSPEIVIADISGIADPLPALHRLADVCDPSTSVLVVGDDNDVVLYRRIKELGVAEYLFKPVTVDLMVRSCRAALVEAEEEQSAPHLGKLVTILGMRGGVGATTLAVNIAWHLATQMGRDVALVDLDLQSGDAALQLDVQPTPALRTALEHPDRVDDLFLDRASVKVGPKLRLFAALEPLADPVLPAQDAVMCVVDTLRRRHRYVLVDSPYGAGPHFDRLLAASNVVILVAEPTLISMRELRRWGDWLKGVRHSGTVCRILNKFGAPGSLALDEFEAAVGAPPDAVVPFDAAVVRGTDSGAPAVDKCRALRKGLAPLFKELSGAPASDTPSLFDRVFGK